MMAVASGLFVLAGAVYEVILIRVVVGVAYAFLGPASIALISDYSKTEERIKVFGYFSFSWSVGILLGPLLGGMIVENFNFRILFITSMLIGGTSLFLALYSFSKAQKDFSPLVIVDTPHIGVKLKNFIPIILIVVVVSMVLSVMFNLFPVYLSNFSFRPSDIGLLFTIFGVTRALTFIQAGRITKLRDTTCIVIGMSCLSVANFSIYASKGFNHFIPTMLVLGFGAGILTPLLEAKASKMVDNERIGSAMGAIESIFRIGWTIGPFIGGLMALSIFGPASPYLMLSFFSAIIFTSIILWMKLKVK